MPTLLYTFHRFTTAIRTSFNFSGQENMAFAGGEELWVFVNGQLVVQVFHDPLNSTIPCATINLTPALKGKEKVVTQTVRGYVLNFMFL